jgi:hypothetical protein
MRVFVRSAVTAGLLALLIVLFSLRVIARHTPQVVGEPLVDQTRAFTWPAEEALRLQNAHGPIEVRTQEGDEITATARIRVYARSEEAVGVAEGYAEELVAVSRADGRLDVVTDPRDPPHRGLDVYVDYRISVPPGTDVAIDSDYGNVLVEAGCGAVTVDGLNTDCEVREPKGPVEVRTTNGRVRLLDAPAGGLLETVNGNVYLHGLAGAFEVETTNGLVVAHVMAPRVEAMDLTTINGGITVVLHRDVAAALFDAQTMTGGVRVDWPVDGAEAPAGRRRMEGVIGEGGPRLTLRTVNGNIWITETGS